MQDSDRRTKRVKKRRDEFIYMQVRVMHIMLEQSRIGCMKCMKNDKETEKINEINAHFHRRFDQESTRESQWEENG